MVVLDDSIALAIHRALIRNRVVSDEVLEEFECALVDSSNPKILCVSINDLHVTRDAIIELLREKGVLDFELEALIKREFDELIGDQLEDEPLLDIDDTYL